VHRGAVTFGDEEQKFLPPSAKEGGMGCGTPSPTGNLKGDVQVLWCAVARVQVKWPRTEPSMIIDER